MIQKQASFIDFFERILHCSYSKQQNQSIMNHIETPLILQKPTKNNTTTMGNFENSITEATSVWNGFDGNFDFEYEYLQYFVKFENS